MRATPSVTVTEMLLLEHIMTSINLNFWRAFILVSRSLISFFSPH